MSQYKPGDRVKFKDTETVRQGRRKVQVEVTREGVVADVGNPFITVEVASLCNGGMTVCAVKLPTEIEPVADSPAGAAG